ncbi:UNVERIFIED_CONTAM: hypothetical protein GTU68_011247 [Idotea baltica]|nr:hypothetical protein [Idotea baltica]
MDKRVVAKLNGGRLVEGVLRGFDPFLNLVVDEGIEIRKSDERVNVGVVVSYTSYYFSYKLVFHSLASLIAVT